MPYDEKGRYYEQWIPEKNGQKHIGYGIYRPIDESQSEKISKPGEFTEYDSSQGHCGLCGRLGCHGGCFK